MLIFNHVTGADYIDFDPATGLWRYPETEPHTPELDIIARFALPVRGSFTEVDGHRYYLYWTADRTLIFRLPDCTEYALFRHLDGAHFADLREEKRIEIGPATSCEGTAIPGYSTVRLRDKNGAELHQVSYFSHRYLQLYMMDITPFTDRDLGTWDFFVALKDAFEKIGAKCSSKSEDLPPVKRIRAITGEPCPRDGYWLIADTMDKQMELQRGQSMPPHQGRNVCWEWVSRDFIPEGLYSD